MKIYPLHRSNDKDFESLAYQICTKILGEGTVLFAEGKDGGRDGRFHGKANCFPSVAEPWKGKIVIQAKFTGKENASCSDNDFTRIVKNDVIPAIKKLKQENLIDYYLLFTNRKLTGIKDSVIENQILTETQISNVVIANEKIQQYLQQYPDIIKTLRLNELLNPLQFDESDLKDVIVALHSALKENKELPKSTDFTTMDLSKKNELNKLSKSYFDDVMLRDFGYFEQIGKFLLSPINENIKDLYNDAISELNAKINLKRNDYVEFENLLEDFYDYIISNDITEKLKGKKVLIRTLLNYMYCNCDIGKKEN